MNWHDEITNWHKSTRTHHEENACVEIGTSHGIVGIRDTKHADTPPLGRAVVIVSTSTFASFLEGART